MEIVTLEIDGRKVTVEKGKTVLEAARSIGIDVPSLCYDPRLEPYGACRLCFVEIEDIPKPVTACSTYAADGMTVTTESSVLTDIRRSALELLLADHCGDCIAPCQKACPAGIDIQGFIAHIANDQYVEAAKLIKEQLPFPASVGRVCPKFCEEECRRNIVDEPVSICLLKRFAGDEGLPTEEGENLRISENTGQKAAVVGGGPAGLSAAYYLRQLGHQVTIFEAEKELGGMLRYGIPEYRLPKSVLDKEINRILDLGIDVRCGSVMGRDFSIETLKKEEGFDSVFITIGCQANQQVKLVGNDRENVFSGIGFLREAAYGSYAELGKNVMIVGGGNTAMDAARTAVRLGADEVTVVYRRTEKEMPAEVDEYEKAKEEGVEFKFLTNPVEIREDHVECIQMELGEPDKSGRRRPIPVEGTEFKVKADSVILALGQVVDADSFRGSSGLKTDSKNFIEINEGTFTTSIEGVFAAGDCVTGPSTVVESIGQSKKAVSIINKYLNGGEVTVDPEPYNCSRGELDEIDPAEYEKEEKKKRVEQTVLPAEESYNFNEVGLGFKEGEALKEADRCLSCGCQDVFDCRLRDLAARYGVQDDKISKFRHKRSVIEDHDYIEHDANKCVLCGSCVRICQEVQGVGALGFVNRGIETEVKPDLELPLSKTFCESCGQCVSACPTGALTIKSSLEKPGPWKLERTEAVCPNCSIGCDIELNTSGSSLVEITSPIKSDINNGNLCVKGTFEYSIYGTNKQQKKPVILRNGAAEEADWAEAFDKAAEGLDGVLDNYGSDSLAVLVSPKVTNEAAYLAQKFARSVLKTNNIDGLDGVELPVRPQEDPGSRFKEIDRSDFVLLLGIDPSGNYPVLGNRLRSASKMGANLGIVSNRPDRLDHLADSTLHISPHEIENLLQLFINYKKLEKTDELEKYIGLINGFITKPEKILRFIDKLYSAEKPVVICDRKTISVKELELIYELVGTAEAGLLVMEPAGNSRGIKMMGVDPKILPGGKPALQKGLSAAEIADKVGNGELKGIVMVAGEDGVPPEYLVDNDVFTVVITPRNQEILRNADVVLPAASYPEMRGSFMNSEERIRWSERAFEPLAGKEIWGIFAEMARRLSEDWQADSLEEVLEAVQRDIGSAFNLSQNTGVFR